MFLNAYIVYQISLGCHLPCQQTKYNIEDLLSVKLDLVPDPKVQEFLVKHDNDPDISMILISYRRSEIINQDEEVYEYDTSRFISEVGGIIGIFIGLSFWSIYLDLVRPIFTTLYEKLKNKKIHSESTDEQ